MSDEPEVAAELTYADWGRLFFEHAVTSDRVLVSVNTLAGRPIEVGPIGVGPGRIAQVLATGSIGAATSERIEDEQGRVGHRIWLPVSLDFSLDLAVHKQRYHAELRVPIDLIATARADLGIFIETVAPRSRDVACELTAEGLRATLTGRVADVDGELRRFVAKYVARELQKPDLMKARTIDVAGRIDAAYRA